MSQKTFNIKDFEERAGKVVNFLDWYNKLHNKWAENGLTPLSREEELEEVKARS